LIMIGERDFEAISGVVKAEEGERLRRMSLENVFKAAEVGERRMNSRIAVDLAETERARRMSEGATAEVESMLGRITAIDLAKQAAEQERARRIGVIEQIIEMKEREFIRENVKELQETERQRRMSEDTPNNEVLSTLNEAIARRHSLKLAGNKFDAEKARRVFQDVAEEAALQAQRKKNLQYVLAEEEKERARRVGESVFAQASSQAMSLVSKKLSRELEETERSRRVAEGFVAQAAVLAVNKREAYLAMVASEAERIERMDDEAKTDNAGRSLLFETIIDELSIPMQAKERFDNQELANELMDMEKLRRMTIEEAYEAQDACSRKEAGRLASLAADAEKAHRMGMVAASAAADKAHSLINRKLSGKLEEDERTRRTSHYPGGISA